MRILSLLALALLGLGEAVRPACAEGGVYDGRYVRVDGAVDATWLERAGELGDALFVRLQRDFGRAPEKSELPLRLTLFPDRTSFEKAVLPLWRRTQQAGRHEVAGGWTRWKPCESFVWLQADAFDTRRLILHELVHQFYARCREASRRGHGAFWYREGLAEYYGWHRRTREGLAFGAFDVATRNPRAHAMRALARSKAWSAYAVATGAQRADYTSAAAVVAALRGMESKALRSRFRQFEAEVLERGGGGQTFARLFRGRAAELDAAVRAWWEAYEIPWRIVRGRWDERDGLLETAPEDVAVAAWLTGPRTWNRARVAIVLPRGSAASAGLLLVRRGAGGVTLSCEVRRGRLTVRQAPAAGGGGAAPGPSLPSREIKACSVPVRDVYRLGVRIDDTSVLVSVMTDDGTTRLVLDRKKLGLASGVALGDVSLIARGGPARFRGLKLDVQARKHTK